MTDLPFERLALQRATPARSPVVPPPSPHGLGTVLSRNIDALKETRLEEDSRSSGQDRLAEAITRFAGSMLFVYIHLIIVLAWVGWNSGIVSGLKPFDASFVILATVASVEAIFLSTFVMISQNRSAVAADRRAELDLQINLLAEHEVTRLVTLTSLIAQHLGIEEGSAPDLEELKQDVAPETVLEELGTDEQDSVEAERH